jgi:pimeloyl-ACP methyl ester carboxylesterase
MGTRSVGERPEAGGQSLAANAELVVAGVRSPYFAVGDQGNREAVVFVHGNPGPATDWSDLLEGVGEFARGVAMDFPGYGAADRPRQFDYSIRGYARYLDGALGELGITRAHIVAHDFGGAWSLTWAAQHPEKFASATLINTGVLIGYRWHRVARIWRTPVLGEVFTAATTMLTAKAILRLQNPGLRGKALDSVARALVQSSGRAVLGLYRATPEEAFAAPAPALAALDRPALVIWGEAEAYLPLEQAELQRRAFPSARIVTLPGTGHWAMHERPGDLREIVLPFLREQVEGHRGHEPGAASAGH